MTIFGNPQMALMASKSNAFVDQNSRLELKTCVEYLWLPTFVVWLLNLIFLLLHYHYSRYRSNRKKPNEEVSSDIGIAEQSEQQEPEQEQQPSTFMRTNSKNIPQSTERYRLRQLGQAGEQIPSIAFREAPVMISRSVSIPSLASLKQFNNEDEDDFQPSNSRFFKIILFLLLIIVIALLFASSNKVYFDIGM